jgi:outer membrane murein-binding lipoprotein Lpp
MSFIDKAKQAAGQAAAKAKEGVEDVQQKIELSQAYGELGKTTFELVESGEISNPKLDSTVAKIRELNTKLAEET